MKIKWTQQMLNEASRFCGYPFDPVDHEKWKRIAAGRVAGLREVFDAEEAKHPNPLLRKPRPAPVDIASKRAEKQAAKT